MCLQNTPKPARKAPPPPSNHIATNIANKDMEQISEESSSNGSKVVPISPESKARSSSDSKVEVSEPRSRSSRSRSSSVEIDENVHRNLEQQQDQPLSNGQGTFNSLGLQDRKILASVIIIIWGKPEKPHI